MNASPCGTDPQLEALRERLHGAITHAHRTVERAQLVLLSLALHGLEGITNGASCSFFPRDDESAVS